MKLEIPADRSCFLALGSLSFSVSHLNVLPSSFWLERILKYKEYVNMLVNIITALTALFYILSSAVKRETH